MSETSVTDRTEQLLAQLSGKGNDDEREVIRELQDTVENFPATMLQQFRRAGKFGVRASCLYFTMRYARRFPEAVDMGIEGLKDRSKVVRYRAAMLLALSLDRRALPFLDEAIASGAPESREHFEGARDAIAEQNQHLFLDRVRTGKMKLNLTLIA